MKKKTKGANWTQEEILLFFKMIGEAMAKIAAAREFAASHPDVATDAGFYELTSPAIVL